MKSFLLLALALSPSVQAGEPHARQDPPPARSLPPLPTGDETIHSPSYRLRVEFQRLQLRTPGAWFNAAQKDVDAFKALVRSFLELPAKSTFVLRPESGQDTQQNWIVTDTTGGDGNWKQIYRIVFDENGKPTKSPVAKGNDFGDDTKKSRLYEAIWNRLGANPEAAAENWKDRARWSDRSAATWDVRNAIEQLTKARVDREETLHFEPVTGPKTDPLKIRYWIVDAQGKRSEPKTLPIGNRE